MISERSLLLEDTLHSAIVYIFVMAGRCVSMSGITSSNPSGGNLSVIHFFFFF